MFLSMFDKKLFSGADYLNEQKLNTQNTKIKQKSL